MTTGSVHMIFSAIGKRGGTPPSIMNFRPYVEHRKHSPRVFATAGEANIECDKLTLNAAVARHGIFHVYRVAEVKFED